MKRIAVRSAVLVAIAVMGLAPTVMRADHRSDPVVSIGAGPASYAGILQFSPIGQTFIHADSSIGSIAVYLQAAGSGSTVTAKLWKGSIDAPGGLVATKVRTVPAGEGWLDFDFVPHVIVSNQTQVYVLELETTSVVPRWRLGEAYADGQVVSPLLPGFLDFTLETYAFVNSAPTDIALDNNTVNENDAGAVIGKLTATDPDPADTHIFTVDDLRFEVDPGDNLKLLAGVSLDFETEASVNIDVTATDGGGLGFTEMFTVFVNDLPDAVGGYVNRCVNDIRRRPSQPLSQRRSHPRIERRDRRLRSTQGPSDA